MTSMLTLTAHDDIAIFANMVRRRLDYCMKTLEGVDIGNLKAAEAPEIVWALSVVHSASTGLVALGYSAASAQMDVDPFFSIRSVNAVANEEFRITYLSALEALESECREWLDYYDGKVISHVEQNFDMYWDGIANDSNTVDRCLTTIQLIRDWIVEEGLK